MTGQALMTILSADIAGGSVNGTLIGATIGYFGRSLSRARPRANVPSRVAVRLSFNSLSVRSSDRSTDRSLLQFRGRPAGVTPRRLRPSLRPFQEISQFRGLHVNHYTMFLEVRKSGASCGLETRD